MVQSAPQSGVLEALNKVKVDINVVIGKSTMPIRQLLKVGRGAVVDLDARHDDPVMIYGNGELIAKGEVVIVGERIGVTITELIDENSDL
ncbi:MAG: FliM/FliN family flagellar motor switch protein [Pseudomonadota bacterium]